MHYPWKTAPHLAELEKDGVRHTLKIAPHFENYVIFGKMHHTWENVQLLERSTTLRKRWGTSKKIGTLGKKRLALRKVINFLKKTSILKKFTALGKMSHI